MSGETFDTYQPPYTLEEHWEMAMLRGMDFLTTVPRPDGVYMQFGTGRKFIDGFQNWDWDEWDADSGEPIPVHDEYADGIICYHTLDHLSEPIRVLAEFQRVMKPGAWLVIVVPHYMSELWHADLTHKSQFAIDTWRNVFSERHYTHKGVVAGHVEWKLEITFNMIMGVAERNLVLVTQFLKGE